MAKVLRWRLVDAPDTKYINNNFDVVAASADIADSKSLLTIASPAAIVLWNDRLDDRSIAVFQGLGTKLLLHPNEYVTITPGSVAEMLYYFAAADDADIYCDTSANFTAAKG